MQTFAYETPPYKNSNLKIGHRLNVIEIFNTFLRQKKLEHKIYSAFFWYQSSHFRSLHKFTTIEQHQPPLSTCFINLLPMNQIFIKLSFESFCQTCHSPSWASQYRAGERCWKYCGLFTNNQSFSRETNKKCVSAYISVFWLRQKEEKGRIGMLKFIN